MFEIDFKGFGWLYQTPLTFLAGVFLLLWIFFSLYVLIMGFYRAYLNKELTIYTKLMAAPWVVLGAGVDVFCNITVASLFFLELPHEFLVTQRLTRYKLQEPTSWRGQVAGWLCANLLDYFDPHGIHCD